MLAKFYYFCIKLCPGGGIGRHTSLRGWRCHKRASSSLVLGTMVIKLYQLIYNLDYYSAAKANINCFIASLLHCFIVSLFHCFIVSLFHCFIVSLLNCHSWSFNSHSIVIQLSFNCLLATSYCLLPTASCQLPPAIVSFFKIGIICG